MPSRLREENRWLLRANSFFAALLAVLRPSPVNMLSRMGGRSIPPALSLALKVQMRDMYVARDLLSFCSMEKRELKWGKTAPLPVGVHVSRIMGTGSKPLPLRLLWSLKRATASLLADWKMQVWSWLLSVALSLVVMRALLGPGSNHFILRDCMAALLWLTNWSHQRMET